MWSFKANKLTINKTVTQYPGSQYATAVPSCHSEEEQLFLICQFATFGDAFGQYTHFLLARIALKNK